jgi:hypothetical protein
MFEMVDTLNFRVNNLAIPSVYFVKETTKGLRYNFGGYSIETAKYYPVTRFIGSLSTLANGGANYPLIGLNDVTNNLRALSDTLGFNLHDAKIERIDLAFDLKTKYPLDPFDFSFVDKKFMWAKSEEGNYINYNLNSTQKLAIYQNGAHNDRPTGLRLESRYIARPFARALSDLKEPLLKLVSTNLIPTLENMQYKPPTFEVSKGITAKMGKKDIDKLLISGFMYQLNEVEFRQLLKNLEVSGGVEKRLLKQYRLQRFEAIRLFKIGKMEPIKQFINLISKL